MYINANLSLESRKETSSRQSLKVVLTYILKINKKLKLKMSYRKQGCLRQWSTVFDTNISILFSMTTQTLPFLRPCVSICPSICNRFVCINISLLYKLKSFIHFLIDQQQAVFISVVCKKREYMYIFFLISLLTSIVVLVKEIIRNTF